MRLKSDALIQQEPIPSLLNSWHALVTEVDALTGHTLK